MFVIIIISLLFIHVLHMSKSIERLNQNTCMIYGL